jgi:hypothetical protein
MQIGIITVDGRWVGTVTVSFDDDTDRFVPAFADDGNPSGRAFGTDTGKSFHHHGIGHSRPSHDDHEQHPAAGHRHGPGHYPRGEERQRRQDEQRQSQPLGDIPYSSSGNPFDRERFRQELEQKPWLREKIKHISLGENQDPRANTAVLETMMNRAVTRGTSLEAQARRHRSSGVDEGGYYAGYNAHPSAESGTMFERNLAEVLKGSNVSGYATDNSSGALAARERASGAFTHHTTLNGENFFSPGHAEPALRERWQHLNKKAQDFERSKTADTAAAKPFDPETMAP